MCRSDFYPPFSVKILLAAVSGVRPPRVVPFGDLEIVFLNEKVQYEAPTELSPTFCEKVGKTWGEN